MTNAMIMMVQTQKLAEQGILKYTGKVLKGVNALGEEVELKEVEPIHTVKIWNDMGYFIKPGQHAIAKFPIWFYKKGKKKSDEDEETAQANGSCYMRTASWFTFDQVETEEERKARQEAMKNK